MNNLHQVSKLDKSDYNRGFLQLLEQLTTVGSKSITYDDFCAHFDKMTTEMYVIRDVSIDRIVESV